MVEGSRVALIEQAASDASPQPVAQAALFVVHAMPDEKKAGKEINVIGGAGGGFEALFGQLCAVQLRAHLMHRGQERGIGSEAPKQGLGGLRRALTIASQDKKHLEVVDFVPARFVLQRHSWGAKAHYDLRIQKLTAPSWFGITLFTDPRGAPTKGEKHMGSVKGYEALVWRRKPSEHGAKVREQVGKPSPLHAGSTPKEHGGLPSTRSTKWENMGEIRWMSFEGKVPPGGPGNPTRNEWAEMKILDSGPAVIHRRELDFIDVTLLGRSLWGRFFHRLVSYPSGVNFFFWRAKHEPANWLSIMARVAARKVNFAPMVIGKGS